MKSLNNRLGVSLFKARPLFLTLLLLLASFMPVAANDGIYYTKGNQLVPLQETDISVRKEVLTISLMDNGYARVDVYYEFWNPGSAVKRLLMGFEADPPYNDDYMFHPDGRHPNIKDFTVEMNGRCLAYHNAACVRDTLPLRPIDTSKRYYVWDDNALYEVSDDNGVEPIDGDLRIFFNYVYYFDADFQPGLNRVHHTYTYCMSKVVGTPYVLEYKLTPAGRWAGGKIDDFTLVIRVDNTAKHFYVLDDATLRGADCDVTEGMGKVRLAKLYKEGCHEVSLRNGAIQFHLNDFHPMSELRIEGVSMYECVDKGDVFHFGATYDRSAPVCLWYSADKVEPADKAFLRRVARNLPFAHRGHVFRDKRLREFFESLWWYMPDPDYRDSTDDFTDVDRMYINAEF